MGWSILKQPNGQFARFSEIVDDFTHTNMDEEEAYKCCLREGLSREQASAKVSRARADEPPYDEAKTNNDGLERYRHALKMIQMVHGKDRANEVRLVTETFRGKIVSASAGIDAFLAAIPEDEDDDE